MRRILNFSFLLIFFLTSYFYNYNLKKNIELAEVNIRAQKKEIEKNYIPPEMDEDIIYYYPNEQFTELLKDTIKVPKELDVKDRLSIILAAQKEKTKEILKYNNIENFVFIDQYLEIENAYVFRGALYIDFNFDFRKNFIDKKHELYFTYSIVNSALELGALEKVKFLILGREINALKFYKLDDFLYKYDLRG